MKQMVGVMLVIVMIGLLADQLLFGPWGKFLPPPLGYGEVKI